MGPNRCPRPSDPIPRERRISKRPSETILENAKPAQQPEIAGTLHLRNPTVNCLLTIEPSRARLCLILCLPRLPSRRLPNHQRSMRKKHQHNQAVYQLLHVDIPLGSDMPVRHPNSVTAGRTTSHPNDPTRPSAGARSARRPRYFPRPVWFRCLAHKPPAARGFLSTTSHPPSEEYPHQSSHCRTIPVTSSLSHLDRVRHYSDPATPLSPTRHLPVSTKRDHPERQEEMPKYYHTDQQLPGPVFQYLRAT